MKKLEIIIDSERQQQHVALLQQRFSAMQPLARSSFFVIVGCYVPALTDEDKIWLEAMMDAKIVRRFRCKEREDR